jgi:II/X family phage/plasmid replication protein
VKTHDQNQLWVSGNPTKFLQGHNIFGSNDLLGICVEFFKQIAERLELPASQGDLSAWLTGNFELKTVDCTESFRLPKQDDVPAWIRAAAPIVRGKHQAASSYSGETIYVGQNSRRISLKIYSKYLELLKHNLPKLLPQKDELKNHAKGLLRVEVRLHSMELKRRRLEKGSDWKNVEIAFEIVKERVMNMKLNQKFRLSSNEISDLPPRLSLVYSAWLNGQDVRTIIPRSSFYRYMSELSEHGIDISSPPPEPGQVIPMLHYLTAEHVAYIPNSFRNHNLYFEPRLVA